MHSHTLGFSNVWVVICCVVDGPGVPIRPAFIAAACPQRPDDVLLLDAQRLFAAQLPPYPTGAHCLVVTFGANALAGCHLALGWHLPERMIDLAVEFRNVSNGAWSPCGHGMIGARVWFGLSASGGINSGPSPMGIEQQLLALIQLFEAMRPAIDLGRALLRGRYMCTVARIERHGVPIDMARLEPLRRDWPAIRDRMVQRTDVAFGVFGSGRFQVEAFARWLEDCGLVWPRAGGGLDLRATVFRDMARAYPELRPLKELMSTLANFEPNALAIGSDGRNRVPLRPFSSRTGRNQPSSKASILGSAAWVRNLVRPAPGKVLASIDWSQQEFGIAAALSGDNAMWTAYETGDPYLALAVRAGAAPLDATATTHAQVREQFKSCALGVQCGMGSETLAQLSQLSDGEARQLIAHHRLTFPVFWRWSDAVENRALLDRRLSSVFGWQVHVDGTANSRFLRNFPVQANGAEMLRLACCLATERGIEVCATLHDAILIEASETDIQEAVRVTQQSMSEASCIVLEGLALRSTVRLIRHSESLGDHRGSVVWSHAERAIQDLGSSGGQGRPAHQRGASRARAHSRPIYLYGSMEDDSDASD